MLIALFKKTKKLRGSVSAMSKAKGKAEAEDIMYKNRGISIETSPNDGTLCHPASSEIAAWPMARLTIPSTVKQFLMRLANDQIPPVHYDLYCNMIIGINPKVLI